ncbi:TPA: hypothetical protein HA265_06350, partial [Candidatus Woesearchaeota archaeon]|nr:hypothetical protein [Candidatus Woesearchaeota archaeon]
MVMNPKKGLKEVRCIKRSYTSKPSYLVGPIRVDGGYAQGEFNVPLATREVPVVFAVNRGKKATNLAGGVRVRIVKDEMTRAPMFRCESLELAGLLDEYIKENQALLAEIGDTTTEYGSVTSLETAIGRTRIGNRETYQLHLRIGMFTGDAAGHNMTEKAAVAIGS